MKPENKLSRVLIAGGTHGNEFTGVHLIKKFEQFPQLIHRSSFETLTLLANPQAFTAVRRYINKDLNRCFLRQNLEDSKLSSYEDLRAKEINHLFGQNGETPVDFILDLHSTTANMGITIIVDNYEPFNLQLAAYLNYMNPSVKVYSSGNSGRSHNSLRSLGRFGICIEVGSVPQGVLNADFVLKTETIIYTILDYLELYNQGKVPSLSNNLICYEYMEAIDYPRNEHGEIKAMIHPHIQFKDYEVLNPGDPMFLTFDGQIISYQGNSSVYPIFINEAAYYEKCIAMCFTEKRMITVE
ncbi:aspartoacylase [Dolichospermum sp. LEGE 00240]|uniref:aspartoacylase n=1 Tax=Dolichospermum sp. LEGE 00240 TaxID=1828603 RepID=UPI001882AECF|nr:aspartoacylase [Dolichospermum sp. LEGE 00240]MBE9250137.1 aspartoacylase [Dolichospermum sp. LEGE 00240]MDM3847123.1 aspartoacylase [Aphanizomenon gracile PMC638.10]